MENENMENENMENENIRNENIRNENIRNENIENHVFVNHPIFRLMMRSVQMIPPQNEDILQTTFDEQKVVNKPTCNKFIENLKELYVNKVDVDNGLSCSICQDEFELNDKVLELPCEPHCHYFHIKNNRCDGVLPWLSVNNTCPMCRSEFPKSEVDEKITDIDTHDIDTSDIETPDITDIETHDIDAPDIETSDTEAPDIESILMNILNSRNQNMFRSIIVDNVRDGFSDNDIDEALRRSLID
jgi:hypothetical protein